MFPLNLAGEETEAQSSCPISDGAGIQTGRRLMPHSPTAAKEAEVPPTSHRLYSAPAGRRGTPTAAGVGP